MLTTLMIILKLSMLHSGVAGSDVSLRAPATLSPTSTDQLPIPFATPASAVLQADLVRAEKCLAKGDFAGAQGFITRLSLNNVVWSADVSAIPPDRRVAAEKAIEEGVKVWETALKGAVTFTKTTPPKLDGATSANLLFIMNPGYIPSNSMSFRNESGPMGCEDFGFLGGPTNNRKLRVKISMDEGPSGTPHSARSISHLAGRGVGGFFGLRPSGGALGIMSIDLHGGYSTIAATPTEIAAAKSVVNAASTIQEFAVAKKKIDLELPEIKFDQDYLELGRVDAKAGVDFVIKFKNTGNATLRISNINADCKCTHKEWDPEVAPGATGKITGSIDGTQFSGMISRGMTIYSNDLVESEKRYIINLTVMRNVATFPSNVSSIELPADKEGENDFFVYSPTGKPFELLAATCTLSGCTATFERGKRKFTPPEYPTLGESERDGYVVKILLNERLGYGGPYNMRVDMVTNLDNEAKLYYVLRMTKGISVNPGVTHYAVFGKEQEKKAVELEQNLAEFKILGVELSSDEVEATVETVREGHEYRIWFTAKPDLQPMTKQIRVLINTDSPKQPKIQAAIWLNVTNDVPGAQPVPGGSGTEH